MFLFFGPKIRGILAPQPEVEPTSPVVEGELLTTGLQGSPWALFKNLSLCVGEVSKIRYSSKCLYILTFTSSLLKKSELIFV